MPIVDRVTESARFCIKDQKRFQDSFFDLDVAAGNGSGSSAPVRAGRQGRRTRAVDSIPFATACFAPTAEVAGTGSRRLISNIQINSSNIVVVYAINPGLEGVVQAIRR